MHDHSPTRALPSILWAIVAIQIAYADILSLHVPGTLEQVIAGQVDGVTLSANLMLLGAVFLQISLAMMALSLILRGRRLRWVTVAAAVVTALFIVGGGSPKPHYIFITLVNLILLGTIVRLNWRAPS